MAAQDDNNDPTAIRQALRGDQAAWTHLVDKYRTYAYRLAWRVTLNEDDALDAVQEVLLKMSSKLADFRGTGSLRSWVTTIAIREATNICRRRSNVPLAMDPDQISHLAEQSTATGGRAADAITNKLDTQRQLARVHTAMQQLSPQQRAILLLAVENDIGPAEIARELGLPANQVRSQQTRAIARLREMMNPETDQTLHDHDKGEASTKRTLR